MKTKKTKFYVSVSILLFASNILYSGLSTQNEKEKMRGKKEDTSLLRKDLLALTQESLPPIKRNIFTRQKTASSEEGIPSPEGFQQPGQKKSPTQQMATAERIRINLKYIGYVQSGKKVVALIILEGKTYAVVSGDILETGLTIGEITPEDIEIFDRGSEPKKISFEGEKP